MVLNGIYRFFLWVYAQVLLPVGALCVDLARGWWISLRRQAWASVLVPIAGMFLACGFPEAGTPILLATAFVAAVPIIHLVVTGTIPFVVVSVVRRRRQALPTTAGTPAPAPAPNPSGLSDAFRTALTATLFWEMLWFISAAAVQMYRFPILCMFSVAIPICFIMFLVYRQIQMGPVMEWTIRAGLATATVGVFLLSGWIVLLSFAGVDPHAWAEAKARAIVGVKAPATTKAAPATGSAAVGSGTGITAPTAPSGPTPPRVSTPSKPASVYTVPVRSGSGWRLYSSVTCTGGCPNPGFDSGFVGTDATDPMWDKGQARQLIISSAFEPVTLTLHHAGWNRTFVFWPSTGKYQDVAHAAVRDISEYEELVADDPDDPFAVPFAEPVRTARSAGRHRPARVP